MPKQRRTDAKISSHHALAVLDNMLVVFKILKISGVFQILPVPHFDLGAINDKLKDWLYFELPDFTLALVVMQDVTARGFLL